MKVLLSVIIGLILFIVALMAFTPLVMYKYEGIEHKFNAEVRQCNNIYNKIMFDSQPDLINNERTNEDLLVTTQTYKMTQCEKIMGSPEYYLRGRYIQFWVGQIASMILFVFIIGMICISVYIGIQNAKKGNNDDDDDDDYQTYY